MPVNKQPQVISEKAWEDIKAACISGMGFSAAARAFGINNVHTIIMKCRRNRWPIPARIQERAKALQEGRYKATNWRVNATVTATRHLKFSRKIGYRVVKRTGPWFSTLLIPRFAG